MANIKHVNLVCETGDSSVRIRGQSSCKQSELRHLAELLSGVLYELKFPGDFVLTPQRKALPGSARLKGLSVSGMRQNAVYIGYQPSGNDSRAEYRLAVGPQRVETMYKTLKDFIGTAYTGEEKPDVVENTVTSEPTPDVEKVPAPTATKAVREKPKSQPEVFYTKDQSFMDDLVLELLELAGKAPSGLVTHDQVCDMVVEMTHYTGRFGISPITNALRNRGYLIEQDEGFFEVNAEPSGPVAAKRRKNKQASGPKKAARSGITRQMPAGSEDFFADQSSLRKFFTGIGLEERASAWMVKHAEEWFPDWAAQRIGHVFGYMNQEDYLDSPRKGVYVIGKNGAAYLDAEKQEVFKNLQAGKSNKYLSNLDWVRACITELRELVKNTGGEISREEMLAFIKRKTDYRREAYLDMILEHLEFRQIIRSSSGEKYEVSFRDIPELEAAVGRRIETARASVKEAVRTLAPIRKPDFAASLFEAINRPQLQNFLAEFLGKAEFTTAFLKEQIEKLYPNISHDSEYRLIRYLIFKGYLLKIGVRGRYKLGPTGLRILGMEKQATPMPTTEPVQAKQVEPAETGNAAKAVFPRTALNLVSANVIVSLLRMIKDGSTLSTPLFDFIRQHQPDRTDWTFREKILNPLVADGWLYKPTLKQYAITVKGIDFLNSLFQDGSPPTITEALAHSPDLPAVDPLPARTGRHHEGPRHIEGKAPASPLGETNLALAAALKKGQQYKADAAAAEAENTSLRARIAELEAQIAAGPSIDEIVNQRLQEMIGDL